MVSVGDSIKVNETYAGDYEIIGKTLTVAAVGPNDEVSVKEKFISKTNQNHQYPSWYNYNPVLFRGEYNKVEYPKIKDRFGKDVSVGDYVAVAPAVHGGVIERGIVRKTWFNETYGRSHQAFNLELETSNIYSDGPDRRFEVPSKTTRQYSSAAGLLLLVKAVDMLD